MKAKKDKEETKQSVFDEQLEKTKGRKLSESRAKTVAEYLCDVFKQEHELIDAIERKAGTQLTLLPIAVTIFAGLGGLLLGKESTRKMSELWTASITFYGMSLTAFIVSGIFALLSLKVTALPGINLKNIIDFEQNDANYLVTIGKHFEQIRGGLRDVNDKKASWLEKSQWALLVGLIFIVICFVLLAIPSFFGKIHN